MKTPTTPSAPGRSSNPARSSPELRPAATSSGIRPHSNAPTAGRSPVNAGRRCGSPGLPASGKSTVAVALERLLVESGRAAYLLDGDNVRHGLSDDLGFSPGDRAENIRRVGHLTRLFADAGVVVIASLVSPLESDRAIARALNDAAQLPFLEIHISTPLAECERRDPKGLYATSTCGRAEGPYRPRCPLRTAHPSRPGSRHHRSRYRPARETGSGAAGITRADGRPSRTGSPRRHQAAAV